MSRLPRPVRRRRRWTGAIGFGRGFVWAATRARERPDRGVIIADHEGNEEAYAWDVATGELRKISDSGTAVLEAAIRPDGESIVYHRDTTGSEFGHLHEVPFGGGSPRDLTPELPEYAAFTVRVVGRRRSCRDGERR